MYQTLQCHTTQDSTFQFCTHISHICIHADVPVEIAVNFNLSETAQEQLTGILWNLVFESLTKFITVLIKI
jgi:hypothetical protein